MLQSLDQIAFNLLIMFYSFLGIQSLPPSDENWEVVESWTNQGDDTYSLKIESVTLPDLCRVSPDSYVVFPAVNLSINNVYLDGKIYQTNSPDGSWKLSETYFKPVIHCRTILSSKVVTQEIRSYLKYMGFISSYPKIEKPTVGFYFLSSDLFFVSTLMIMLITLINSILIVTSGNLSKFKYSIIQDLSVLAVVLIISPGKYFEAELHITNEACLSLLLTAIYMFGHTVGFVNRKTAAFFVPFVFSIYLVSIGHKHLMQFLIVSLYPVLVVWVCAVAYRYFKRTRWERYDIGIYYVQLTIFSMIVVSGIFDGIASELSFNKFVLLPIGYTLISVFNFVDIVRLLGAQKYKNFTLQNEINQQVAVINKLMQSYERYQEIIHDIKSPLTGLNFALSSDKGNTSEVLSQLKNRLNELLIKAQHSLRESIPGWVDVSEVYIIWKNLSDEYRGRININFKSDNVSSNLMIWCELTSLKAIAAELVDNAIKADVEEVEVIISVHKEIQNLNMVFLNKRSSLKNTQNISQGSGKGLDFIDARINAWNGSFEVERPSYNSTFSFQAKSRDS